jgi:hypothetical protein
MAAGIRVVGIDQEVGIAGANFLDPEAVHGWPGKTDWRIE